MVERRVTWHTQYLCWFLPDKQRLRELARVYNEETEAFDRLNTNPGARNRFAAETFRRLKNMAIREGVDGDLLAEIRADLRHFERNA